MSKEKFIEIQGKSLRILGKDERLPSASDAMTDVFLIGCRGIPARYGGFETFVENLTYYSQNPGIRFHAARMAEDNIRYEYHNSECFDVRTPGIKSATAVVYDLLAIHRAVKFCRRHPEIRKPVFYILACRIGPWIGFCKYYIRKLDGRLLLNPDGHEWKRSKWSAPVKKYWKYSEGKMVRSADLVICDSKGIEEYIRNEYGNSAAKTTFIAYGSDTDVSAFSEEDEKTYRAWLERFQIQEGNYYLVVGRLVPENNYAVIVREFMRSRSERQLVIISTANRRLLDSIDEQYHYRSDPRVKFVGTMYCEEVLKRIRERSCGYIHGHEVGGTNPGLLEALGHTKLNLLHDVVFNREVAGDTALYWNKEEGNLAALIEKVETFPQETIDQMGQACVARMRQFYSWQSIAEQYERVFLQQGSERIED